MSWIDQAGIDPAIVRHSGAVGFPLGWPDIQGIAVRVQVGGTASDLLFATTGLGRLTRYLLSGSRTIDGRPYTTLLPYRAPNGPVVLGLEPQGPTTMTLLWAPASGNWRAFGTLELTDSYDGPEISFDPMVRAMPDLPPYPWVKALRAPSYSAAREHRDEASPDPS